MDNEFYLTTDKATVCPILEIVKCKHLLKQSDSCKKNEKETCWVEFVQNYVPYQCGCIPRANVCPILEILKCKQLLKQSNSCNKNEKETCSVQFLEKSVQYQCGCIPRDFCEPAEMDNGNFTCEKLENENKTECNFTCGKHFELKGRNTVNCDESGEWSADMPKCVHVDCPENETVRCFEEKKCESLDETICEVQSKNFICDCRKREYICQIPKIENGRIECFEEECIVLCKDGYYLEGEAINKCELIEINEQRNWTNAFPKCKVAICPLVQKLKCKQSLKQSYSCLDDEKGECFLQFLGPSVQYECRCLRRDFCEPSELDNGNVTCKKLENTNSTECQFTCDEHFELKGTNKLSCDESGEWSSDMPKCLHVDCSENETARCFEEKKCGSLEETICKVQSTNFTCDCRNIVNDKNFPCQIPKIKNARIECFDEGCIVLCKDDYYLEGEAIHKCERNPHSGEWNWSNTLPKCKAVSYNCPIPEKKAERYRHCSTRRRLNKPWKCNFECKEHFLEAGGNKTLSCQTNGEWIYESPNPMAYVHYWETTREIEATPLICKTHYNDSCDNWPLYSEIFPKGKITPIVEYILAPKNVITMKTNAIICEGKFRFEGNDSVQCNSTSGKWIFGNAECKLADPYACENIVPGKGQIVRCTENSTNRSLQCDIQCEVGYHESIDGERRVQCMFGRQWSGNPLTCHENYNCRFNWEENRRKKCEQRSFDKSWSCTFSCHDGHMLISPQKVENEITLECHKNGQWSNSEPFCRKHFDCPPIIDNDESGREVYCKPWQNWNERHYCWVECRYGFQIVSGSNLIYCEKDGTWSGYQRHCRKTKFF